MSAETPVERGLTARIVELFITSKLSILLLIASLVAGFAALVLTPREEEPQIVVPVADVLISAPGARAEEVEKLVSTPLETLLREVDGVEYVYSASREGEALVTVRFFVGEDREDSLVKVWNKLMSNQDRIPPLVSSWTVKPVEIDDVPIVTLALSSSDPSYDAAALRRLADEMKDKLAVVEDAGKITVIGGERRQVSVYPDPARLAAHGTTVLDVMRALQAANINLQAGTFEQANRVVRLDAGPFFTGADEVAGTPVAGQGGRLVYLRDVAEVMDGPQEASSYTRPRKAPGWAKRKRRNLARSGRRSRWPSPSGKGRMPSQWPKRSSRRRAGYTAPSFPKTSPSTSPAITARPRITRSTNWSGICSSPSPRSSFFWLSPWGRRSLSSLPWRCR